MRGSLLCAGLLTPHSGSTAGLLLFAFFCLSDSNPCLAHWGGPKERETFGPRPWLGRETGHNRDRPQPRALGPPDPKPTVVPTFMTHALTEVILMFPTFCWQRWILSCFSSPRISQVRRRRSSRRETTAAIVQRLEPRLLLTTIDLASLGAAGTTIFGADAGDQSGRSVRKSEKIT